MGSQFPPPNQITMDNNIANALRIFDIVTSSNYISIDTITGSEKIDLGENTYMNFNKLIFSDDAPPSVQFSQIYAVGLNLFVESEFDMEIRAGDDLIISNGWDDLTGDITLLSENNLHFTTNSGDLNINLTGGSMNLLNGKIFVFENAAGDSEFEIKNIGATTVSTLQLGDSFTIEEISGNFVSSGLAYPTADGTKFQLMTTNGLGSLSFADLPTSIESGFWDSTTNTQTPPPSDGKVIWDNATQINSSNIFLEYTTINGFDGSTFIQSIQADDIFEIAAVGSLGNTQKWKVTTNTDNTTYATLGVTLLSGTVQFSNNSKLQIFFQTQASGSLFTPGGVSGNIQYNNAGAFGGILDSSWDGTTFRLGSGSSNSSAIFQMKSTTQGILFPFMTTTQKLAISTPTSGLIIFDSDVILPQWHDGQKWLGPHTFRFTNRTGGTAVIGECISIDTANDFSIKYPAGGGDRSVIGVVVEGGANLSEIVVASGGIADCFVRGGDTIISGDYLESDAGTPGRWRKDAGISNSSAAQCLEASASGSDRMVRCFISFPPLN